MTCKESIRKINLLIWEDDVIKADKLLIDHLSACDSCRLYYNNYIQGIDALRSDVKRCKLDQAIASKIVERSLRGKSEINLKVNTIFRIASPKIVWSIASAAAAFFIGIYIANSAFNPLVNQADMEAYKNEISMNSFNLGGADEQLINYFENE